MIKDKNAEKNAVRRQSNGETEILRREARQGKGDFFFLGGM